MKLTKKYFFTFQRKSIAIYFVLIFVCGGNFNSHGNTFDSLSNKYSLLSQDYDSLGLVKFIDDLSSYQKNDISKSQKFLLIGLANFRLELIAFCKNHKEMIYSYGQRSIEMLKNAEENGADKYLTSGHTALAFQLISSIGVDKAIKYGPKAGSEYKRLAKIKQNGYLTNLVHAGNLLQAPSFAGGNPSKALLLLESMQKQYPDSIDVKINLSLAYLKNKKKSEAQSLIQPLLKANPENLFVRKVANEIAK